MRDPKCIEDFLAILASKKGFSANTLSAYHNDLTQLNAFLDAPPGPNMGPVARWLDVTRDDLISFLLFLKERSYAPTTVARKQAAVKSFFKFMASHGIIPSSPARELASPRVDRGLPRTVSESEVDQLTESLDSAGRGPDALRDGAMLRLIYASGLRVGEMVALDVDDVDLDRAMITARGRSVPRHVSIDSEAAVQALREYLSIGRPVLAHEREGGASLADTDRTALFLNHRGQRLTRQGFWLILKRYARSAGLEEITPHTLRHSFARQRLKSGTDMRDLQQILGHASISTTQVYARMDERSRNGTEPIGPRRGRGEPSAR